MKTFKHFLAEANRVTPDEIIRRILDIRDGKFTPISRKTCWNQVGLYLRAFPQTKGSILLYGVDDGTPLEEQYVNHAVLVDEAGAVLVDSGGGTISANQKRYTTKDGNDGLDLLLKHTLS